MLTAAQSTPASARRQSSVREDTWTLRSTLCWAVNLNLKQEEFRMNSEYTVSEVVEIGKAQEVILGGKLPGATDDSNQSIDPPEDFD
jgi:hypothetical protein